MIAVLSDFFSKPFVYPCVLGLTALFLFFAAVFMLTVCRRNAKICNELPRWKIPGLVLGAVDLLWCIPNAMPILPENLHKYLLPLVPVLLIASWLALDHLFARAIGGFMILSAHYFLKESFAAPQAGSALFALLTLAYGTLGIYYSGLPFKVRDTLQLASGKYFWCAPLFLIVYGTDALLTAILAGRSL